ncbi:MAG: phytoene desaturase family protein [Myxococcota bacterium]
MGRQRVVVIGAGMGGLSAALELARRGLAVTVLESQASVGGKMRRVAVEGLEIDSGPTVLTMRWVFEALFKAAGTALASEVRLLTSERVGRHRFADGSTLDLWTDLERSTAAIAAFAGPAEAEAFRRFARRTQEIYQTVREPFLLSERPTPLSLAKRFGLSAISRLQAIEGAKKLWPMLESSFKDPRLRQLFGRYATYVGSSPFRTPATMSLIAHVESEGVWFVEGGMRALAESVWRVAAGHGAELHLSAAVQEIELRGGRVSAVRTQDGRRFPAEVVVFNGAAEALSQGLLGVGVRGSGPPLREPSLSAITWSTRARVRGLPLVRHNVIFSADSRAEFQALAEGRAPEDPTIYVCAQDRGDADQPGAERERLLILMNAPADPQRFDQEEVQRCQVKMVERLERSGLILEDPSWIITGPSDFARLYPGSGGALYGMAAHGTWSAFQRPAQRTETPGLYLAGGTTHPGPGVPMAALSGMTTARLIAEDLPST